MHTLADSTPPTIIAFGLDQSFHADPMHIATELV
jgi:hypothetical protein